MLIGHANTFLNVTRNCDSLGRCYQETLTYGPPLDVFASPLTLLRQFDAASNRIGLGYPSGQTLRYDFGSDNRFMQLQSLANAVAYPGDPGAPANRSILQKQRWGDLTITSQFGNGVMIASAYDAAGRRIADACSLPTGQNLALQQLWDGAGNRALTIEIQAGTPIGWWHAYDSTNRLIGSLSLSNAQAVVTGPLAPPNAPLVVSAFRCQQAIDAIVSGYGMSLPAQPGLDYDAAGNRARQETNGGTTLYSANVRNEYVTVGGEPLTYDRAGRLISDTQFTFAYNFRGQLVEAVSQSSGIQIFHDANGMPVGIVEGARKRVLVVDGVNPIETYDNGVLSAVYLWEGQDRLSFFATVGKDEYVFRDVLSSTRLTSDSQGAMTGAFRYDPFGNLIGGSPSAPFLYCGRYLYAAVGWYEYRTRQYIPTLGRFAQSDPAGFADGANLYTFVGSNPLSATDPTGMDRQNVARGATSESDQIGWATYRIDDVYRGTSQIVRIPYPLSPSYSPPVGGWMSGMPYGRMLTLIDSGGELPPPPLVDAEDPLSPPPLVDAPNYQPSPRTTRPMAPTLHRVAPPQPFVPISAEEARRLRRINDEMLAEGYRRISAQLRENITRALLTTAPENISKWEGHVVDFCTYLPVCGPFKELAETIADTAEVISIVGTAYYAGLNAGGGKAGRKIFNNVVEKKLEILLPEKVAHGVARAIDQIIGEKVEQGIRRLLPVGPQLPPETP
jgi:RHS repeat-associated protein